MSDICDLIEHWFELTPERRCEMLSDWLKETAAEWGLDDLNVVCAIPAEFWKPDGTIPGGVYDHDTETIYIDPLYFERDGLDGAVWTAGHELRHADQEEFYEDFGYPDAHDAEDRETLERDADDFANAFVDEVKAECLDRVPVESPYRPPADRAREETGSPPYPEGDWELPSEGEAPA